MKFYHYLIVGITAISITGCCCNKPTKNKIVIWHWVNDRQETFDQLAKQYKNETGIDVEFRLFFPPDIYQQKIVAAARAGNLPDIFGILGEKTTLASFAKAGHLLDLTPAMDENDALWRKTFYPQNLAITSFNQNNSYQAPRGVYGVPIDTTIMQFIYNKKLLKEAGLDPDLPPKTIDEMITMAQTIHEKNPKIYGFSCGWGESWLINAVAIELAINQMGEEKLIKTIKGETPYTDPDWVKVFNVFKKLRESQILAPNIVSMINKESEETFAQNRSVFTFNGSWAVNVYKRLNPELDYGYFTLPKINDKNAAKAWGGSGSSFIINAQSQNKEQAISFLRWLTAIKQQKFLIDNTDNLPAIQIPTDQLPKKLQPLVNELQNLTHPYLWPINENTKVLETFSKALQQVAMGTQTPENATKDIQKEKILAGRNE
jgi:raffinose/stachyose/melibiose transport system substrate-binding protein